jgi:LysR family transcriptional regulator, low CO2-responsive transcriptional regulator
MRSATLRQLKSFSLVARHHSFVHAADELHLTPSAVSLQIKELEQAVGLPLFQRNSKSVSLTPAGDVLLLDVHRALQALQHAEDALTRLRGHEACAISIGMVSSAKYFLPRMLADFREVHRHLDLHLSVGNRDQLAEQLRRGQIDLAVMGTPPAEIEAQAEPFATQPLGIVAAPGHWLAHERAIPVIALSEQEFIVREPGSGTRAAMERFFLSARIQPPQGTEMTSNGAIKQAVMARMGLAFLSLHAAGPELQANRLVAIDVLGLPMLRHWFVVSVGGASLTQAAQSLRSFILERGAASIAEQFEDRATA